MHAAYHGVALLADLLSCDRCKRKAVHSFFAHAEKAPSDADTLFNHGQWFRDQ